MKKLLYSFFAIYITCTAKAQDAVDIWNLPPLNVEQGRYTTDWDNLSRQYNTPSWWREAKLGAWSHWDPQSMAEDGDWYSRGMYLEGHPQSKFHREHFGHPSEYGYKELCRDWKIDLWDPEDLMRLYQKMGARYFLALGNHHDNFDCWDSKYQPWNAVNIGPHQDIVGIDMGLGKMTPQIIANFYNIADKRPSGRKEVVATFKGVGGRYNSFLRNPEMVGIVDHSLVKSTELYTEDDIMVFPFQTEVSLQEWHYQQGAPYRSAEEIIM